MGETRPKSATIITTSELLRLCLEHQGSDDTAVRDAADSLRSYLVLHLRHRSVVIPDNLRTHYDLLTGAC